MKPKYAIVRVDNCPSKFEKGFNDYFVCDGRGKDTRLGKDKIICKNCRYGDTKEQLIRKVAQKIFEDENRNWVNTFGEDWMLKKYINMNREKSLKLAKEIVEFLGVEE